MCHSYGQKHKLKEQLLRDAATRSEARTQQGPETLDGVDVDFAKTIAIIICKLYLL